MTYAKIVFERISDHLRWAKSFRAGPAPTVAGLVAAVAMASTAVGAQTLTALHSFEGKIDGEYPLAAPVQATNGNFYGTTENYGANDEGGTVFEITPSGTLTTLYSFCSQAGCTDGQHPESMLIQGTGGNLYGTTAEGGNSGCDQGCGTIFRVTLSGSLTTLYDFCSQGNCTDGSDPQGGLIQGADGNFYGTTTDGGANSACQGGCGTVFKITPSGTLTTLYNFCSQSNCTDGQYPSAALVQAANGNFYGTTYGGGANGSCESGCGTAFKITPAGALTTLYSFCSKSGCADGEYPLAPLIQATNGNFYGTTYGGGANGGGSIFEISSRGALTTLYSFCRSSCADGANPGGGLIQATDGNLYGTTEGAGAKGYGTIFRITPRGTLTTLYSFCSQSACADGESPQEGLTQGTDGNFYGTAIFGGNNFLGTVFSLSVGLNPFVETQPTVGKAGVDIKILGMNLAGSTDVSFNGTPAAFNVISSSLVQATVPAGATNGFVTVTTPGGTLKSNLEFRIRP